MAICAICQLTGRLGGPRMAAVRPIDHRRRLPAVATSSASAARWTDAWARGQRQRR